MEHYFYDVPGLGNVAVSRHAQARIREEGITEEDFGRVLFKGRTVPDGLSVVCRCLNDIRLVILLRPEPFRGAVLVKTAFREKANLRVCK